MRIEELCRLVALVLLVLSGMAHASAPLSPKVSGDDDVFLTPLASVCIVLGTSATAAAVAKQHGALLFPEDHAKQGITCVRDDESSEILGIETFNLTFLAVVSAKAQATMTVLHVDTGYHIRECLGATLVYDLQKDAEPDLRRASTVAK